MSRSIWKYPFPILKSQTIDMPADAQVLTVAQQGTEFVVWALLTPTEPIEPRQFDLYGTGWDLPDERVGRYIATVQDGAFVWHIFEPGGQRKRVKP